MLRLLKTPRSMIKARSSSSDRFRLVEVASGRTAFVGLVSTAVVGNVTGMSMVTQYHHHAPIVWFATAAVAAHAYHSTGGQITQQEAALEVQSGRAAMVVMLALYVFDKLAISA